MNSRYKIELYQTGKKASLYTIRLSGESETEFDKFLADSEITSDPEFEAFLSYIHDILNKYGCQKRFFKLKESKNEDAVAALWRGKIRLYCCRYSDIIIIVGSGGIKQTRRYQDDPKLNQVVKLMAEVSMRMDERIHNKDIKYIENKFIGNLDFGED